MIVEGKVERMLQAGIIGPFLSAWSFPVVIATKKDGKQRFFVDYRMLNQVMIANCWLLPNIMKIFDKIKDQLCSLALMVSRDTGSS